MTDANELSKSSFRREYLGVKEAEEMTGVSRWTWRRWAYDGKCGSVKFGKRLMIPRSEIDRIVREGTREPLPVTA